MKTLILSIYLLICLYVILELWTAPLEKDLYNTHHKQTFYFRFLRKIKSLYS